MTTNHTSVPELLRSVSDDLHHATHGGAFPAAAFHELLDKVSHLRALADRFEKPTDGMQEAAYTAWRKVPEGVPMYEHMAPLVSAAIAAAGEGL